MTPPFAESARKLLIAVAILGSSLSLAETPLLENSVSADVRFDLRIKNRKVVGDQVIRVTQGQIVEMIWTTDEKSQVHVHGYEIQIEASPDTPTEVTFVARATGRYPVTNHGFGDEHGKMHQVLLYFEVYPK
jgi:heme/copper-type cytochrome/quinol oxidase subunit 2